MDIGYAPTRTSYDGYAPMDMLLPTVDMLRPGYAPMDMLLLNCGYASTKDWIFYFMGKNLNHNF